MTGSYPTPSKLNSKSPGVRQRRLWSPVTPFFESEEALREQAWIECDDFVAQQLGSVIAHIIPPFFFGANSFFDIPHRPEAGIRDDRLFVLEVALKKPLVAIYSHPVFAHRHHSQDRLQSAGGLREAVTNFQHLTIYRRILGELARRGELTTRRRRAASRVLWPLAHWISYTHPEEGAAVADWIVELVPDFTVPEPGVLG